MKRSHLKLYLSCLLVGAVTAVFTIPFRYLLMKAVVVRNFIYSHDFGLWFHFVVIGVMWLVALGIYALVKKYPLISGGGNSQVEGLLYGRFHFVHTFKMLISKFIGGLSGIGMGFSLGREGPSVEMGAFVAKIVSRWVKATPAEEKYLINGGVSAGFSSAFTVPLASSIYIIEGVEKFNSPKIALSTLLAAIVSGWVAQLVFYDNRYSVINTGYPEEMTLFSLFMAFLVFSLVLSLMGKSFNRSMEIFHDLYAKMKFPIYYRILAVVVITYIIGYYFPDIVSGGENFMLDEAVAMRSTIWDVGLSIILIHLFTSICTVTGFPGGIFIPLLVLGALTGKFFALILVHFGWLSPDHFGFFMVLGMAALFAAIIRSPITGLVLVLEMTQKFSILLPMIVVVGFTYFFSQLINVKPVYRLMYKRLLPTDMKQSQRRISIPFEIGEGVYMDGRKVSAVRLPEGCLIKQVVRNGKEYKNRDFVMRENDMVEIELYERDLELLYRSFFSMTEE